MPRKFRPGKGKRFNFDFHELSIRDTLIFIGDRPPAFPIDAGSGDRIVTREDCASAWEACRSYYLDGGFQAHDRPSPGDWYMRHPPGRRDWPYWIFDRQYLTVPSNQISELQRLRELLPVEFEAAQRLARDHPSSFSAAELKTLLGDLHVV
jgi:hypothetical protein